MDKGKKKILIIDDEKDLCMLMKLNLESTDEFEVTTVNSGEEGIKKVKEEVFDLVITDYKMPGMDGVEVLKALKEMKPLSPVVLFSIYHDDDSRVTPVVREKADSLISKPIDHDELYNTIKRVLEKSGKNGE